MTRMAFMAAGLTMLSCSSSSKEGAGDSGSGSDDGGCNVENVAVVYPASDGATDFYYRGSVEFALDNADESATISLVAKSGGDVSGTSSYNDETDAVSFTPDASLDPSSDYVATLSYCGGDVSVGFRTSSLGEALEEGAKGLEGRTYVVNLGSANFVKPAGVGSLIGQFLTQNILLGVVEADDDTMVMRGAISLEGSSAQDFCNPSIEFPDRADFSEAPYFQIGPEDTALSAAGFEIKINQLRISGDFAPDYSYFGGGILEGEIDARDLSAILADQGIIEEDDASAVCELIQPFGVVCEACESDGAALCLSIYVNQILALEDAGQTLELVEECDPVRCEEQGSSCDDVEE